MVAVPFVQFAGVVETQKFTGAPDGKQIIGIEFAEQFRFNIDLINF